MFFSLLFKEKNLNPFDLHMHPINDQICQAAKSRRLPVASLCQVTVKELNAEGLKFHTKYLNLLYSVLVQHPWFSSPPY